MSFIKFEKLDRSTARPNRIEFFKSIGRNWTHVTEGSRFGVQLLAVLVIVGARNSHGESQVAQTARQVGFDQHVARVDVTVRDTQLPVVCSKIKWRDQFFVPSKWAPLCRVFDGTHFHLR